MKLRGFRGHRWIDAQARALRDALDLVDGAFFVGVTELYAESLCVLRHKAGVALDRAACECGGAAGATHISKTTDAAALGVGAMSKALLARVHRLTRLDAVLHAAAVARLAREVRAVERAVGFPILCGPKLTEVTSGV